MNIPFEDYKIEELIELRNKLNDYITKNQKDIIIKTENLNTEIKSGLTHITNMVSSHIDSYTSNIDGYTTHINNNSPIKIVNCSKYGRFTKDLFQLYE